MDYGELENDPFFEALIKHIPAQNYLFRQGQSGNTMFIILYGTVKLLAERNGEEVVEAHLGEGQFLGEKAIVRETPHQRMFSAQAESAVRALELGLAEFTMIEKMAPQLMVGILKSVFQLAAERLERGNYLARLLRSSDNRLRFVELIRYFCLSTGLKTKKGFYLSLSFDTFSHLIDISHEEVQEYLNQLVGQDLVIPADGTHYFIPNPHALADASVNLFFEKAA